MKLKILTIWSVDNIGFTNAFLATGNDSASLLIIINKKNYIDKNDREFSHLNKNLIIKNNVGMGHNAIPNLI